MLQLNKNYFLSQENSEKTLSFRTSLLTFYMENVVCPIKTKHHFKISVDVGGKYTQKIKHSQISTENISIGPN